MFVGVEAPSENPTAEMRSTRLTSEVAMMQKFVQNPTSTGWRFVRRCPSLGDRCSQWSGEGLWECTLPAHDQLGAVRIVASNWNFQFMPVGSTIGN